MEMSKTLEVYGQFVLEEDQLVKRIHTCEQIMGTICSLVYKECQELHSLTVEDVLMSIHRIQQDLQTELLHLRLEKAVVSFKHSNCLPLDTTE
jgi:hypothetical protein